MSWIGAFGSSGLPTPPGSPGALSRSPGCGSGSDCARGSAGHPAPVCAFLGDRGVVTDGHLHSDLEARDAARIHGVHGQRRVRVSWARKAELNHLIGHRQPAGLIAQSPEGAMSPGAVSRRSLGDQVDGGHPGRRGRGTGRAGRERGKSRSRPAPIQARPVRTTRGVRSAGDPEPDDSSQQPDERRHQSRGAHQAAGCVSGRLEGGPVGGPGEQGKGRE